MRVRGRGVPNLQAHVLEAREVETEQMHLVTHYRKQKGNGERVSVHREKMQ